MTTTSRTPPARAATAIALTLLLAGGAASRDARQATLTPATEPAPREIALPGWSEAKLDASHWIARWPDAESVHLDAAAVAAQNARTLREDASLVDLAALPAALPASTFLPRMALMAAPSHAPRFHASGTPVTADDWKRWASLLDVASRYGDLDTEVAPRWALVTRRAALRTVPTLERVFSAPGETDLDRFQESALFPGTPVAVLHTSADGAWHFVQAPNYAAWIAADALAFGDRDAVLGYAARATRVITAAEARLATTPEAPALSGLVLDMGTTLPERRDVDPTTAINGQAAMGNIVLELPTRDGDGALRLVPALLPRSEPSRDGPLPASRANVLRQAFRFLGERYGWGHDVDGRDCSGFIVEVYRSVGLVLPRNTRDQAASPAFRRTEIPADWTLERRLEALATLQPGDLAYLPGHVVMVVGRDEHGPWVIHDVHRGRVPDGTGGLAPFPINGVAVTPLLPLHTSDGRSYVEALTALQQVLPPDQDATQ